MVVQSYKRSAFFDLKIVIQDAVNEYDHLVLYEISILSRWIPLYWLRNHSFKDMDITVSKYLASNTVVQITLGRILLAMIAFRDLIIEWVVTKRYTESGDSSADLMTKSKQQRSISSRLAAMKYLLNYFCIG